MPAIITCDQIGAALLAWLQSATPEEIAAVVAALGVPLQTSGAMPPATTNSALPAVMFGGSDSVLGTPVGWRNVDGYVIPYYDIDNCP